MAIIILIILCLYTLKALWPTGFFYSQDGAYHLVRLIQFYDELVNGQFPVRLSENLAFNFGYPVYNFNYPLAYYIGSFIHIIGFDFGSSIKLIIGITTVGSVLSCYYWLSKHFSRWGAFTGASLFLLVPYRFLATYVVGSIGANLALFFVPLILLSIYLTLIEERFIGRVLLSLGIFGLLLSHNVTAMMFAPILCAYSVVLIVSKKVERGALLIFIISSVLGLAMAAFFVFPALMELNLVKLSKGVVVPFREHFPTLSQLIYSAWGYGYSESGTRDGMSFQVGITQWIAAIVASILFILNKSKTAVVGIMIIIFWITIFLMLQISQPIWDVIKPMEQIQFPWRLLAIVMLSGAVMGAFVTDSVNRKPVAILIVIFALVANRNFLRPMEGVRYVDDYYISNQLLFNGSTDIAWENLPINVIEQQSWFSNRDYLVDPGVSVERVINTPGSRMSLISDANHPSELIINKYYFPKWVVYIDNRIVETSPATISGLIEVNLPAGKHTIDLKLTNTQLEDTCNYISLIAILIFVLWTGVTYFNCSTPRKYLSARDT